MEYLKIKKWEDYQHYKDRNPPWIKLHVKILNDKKFISLSRASKCLLMLLWVLGSEEDGIIPNDVDELKFRFRDNTIKQSEINLLIDKGFLLRDNNMQADDSTLQADACLETETETETDKKKKFIPPKVEDVIKYFTDNNHTKESAIHAFKYYNEAEPPWTDSRGQKVRGWKQKMRGVWFKDENKIKESEIKKQKSIHAGDMTIYEN